MIDWTRPNLRRETLSDYGTGALFFAAAFALRFFAADALADLPFILFILAVLFSAYFGGWRVATLVATASFFSAWYFFLQPFGSWALIWPDPIGLFLFAVVCGSQIGLVAMLVESLRRRDAKRQQLEEQKALEQTLFQELQHRVANGMQLISGILSLQARVLAPQSEAKAAIDAAAARLSTLARVHRRLHDPALGNEGIGVALREITQDILEAAGRQDVTVTVEAPGVATSPAAGTSLAMVVAEATANALKHAFAGRSGGRLDVKLRPQAADWLLTITDDGPGYPAGQGPNENSLGLMIVRSMATRLGGRVEFSNAETGGARMTLRFPDPANRQEPRPSDPAQQYGRRRADCALP